MKKIMLILMFFMLSILVLGNQNYDEAKYRSDVLNEASKMKGWKYDNYKRMQNGYADCSSLVGRASHKAGMYGGITGKGSPNWVTNTDGMAYMVKKLDYNQIKPGDILQFSKVPGKYGGFGHVGYVVENLGNGKFKMLHAGNPVNIQEIDVKTWRSGSYKGVITATDVLIANGYTPVNQNGQVITSPAGNITTPKPEEKQTPATLEGKYDFSWEEYQQEWLDMIFEGKESLKGALGLLLSVLTVIQILMTSIPYLFANEMMSLIINIGKTILKFTYILYIINNFDMLIGLAYEFFAGIGLLFLNNAELNTLDALFASTWKEAVKILKLINEYNLSWFDIITQKFLYDQNFYKVLMLFFIFLMLMCITGIILLNLIFITISFYLGTGLSLFNLSLGTLEYTQNIGMRPRRTLFALGMRISLIIIFNIIIYNTLEKIDFGSYTLDTITFENMFLFIVIGALLAILVSKFDSIMDNINS